MRTSNPALNESVFHNEALTAESTQAMTLEGTVWKTGVLLAILVGAAGFTWTQVLANPQAVGGYITLGGIGALVTAFVTIFKPRVAPYSAPLYAALEGLALGGISAVFEAKFEGIVIQAVGLTFGTLAALLVVYATGLVKATENFKLGICAATGAICLVYLATFVMRLFHMDVGFIHGSGTTGVLFSLFVVTIAALNLVLDFDFIETGVREAAPKYMEWYGGFGLLVTLVWLYLEILRLLAKARSRD